VGGSLLFQVRSEAHKVFGEVQLSTRYLGLGRELSAVNFPGGFRAPAKKFSCVFGLSGNLILNGLNIRVYTSQDSVIRRYLSALTFQISLLVRRGPNSDGGYGPLPPPP